MSRGVFRSAWTYIFILLLFAAAQIAHRTPPVRHDSFFFDFSNVYSASRAWLNGQNPYNINDVYTAWAGSNHGRYLGTDDPAGMRTWAAVYPPSSLLMIAPFAALSAVPGHILWVATSNALLIATFIALFSLAGIHDRLSRILLIACALASAPLQCAMESGQLALPSCALIILAVFAFSKDRQILAGILLGVATAMKVQVGAPFILYYLFIRQWRVATLAAILFAVATMATIARMESIGISTWSADWHRNVAMTLDLGQINDPRPGGPFRNDMVNLQTLLDVVIHRQLDINFCVVLLYMPLLVGFLSHVRPGRAAGTDLLALSLVAALSMLPIYRRLYDSVLLLMLLAWAIARLRTNERAIGIAVLALLGEFLVPIDLVPFILRRTHAFDSIISSPWWQGVIVPHHAWGLLVATVGASYIFNHRTRPAAAPRAQVETPHHSAVTASPHSA